MNTTNIRLPFYCVTNEESLYQEERVDIVELPLHYQQIDLHQTDAAKASFSRKNTYREWFYLYFCQRFKDNTPVYI
ncbi:MAG: hypothetical protein IKH22_01120 [Prevotella sp.]|nr:hypothetical protein [Prevotella sp.]